MNAVKNRIPPYKHFRARFSHIFEYPMPRQFPMNMGLGGVSGTLWYKKLIFWAE